MADSGPNQISPVRMDEFDEEEWRDVCRRLRPDLTDEDFEAAMAEFAELKRRHAANQDHP